LRRRNKILAAVVIVALVLVLAPMIPVSKGSFESGFVDIGFKSVTAWAFGCGVVINAGHVALNGSFVASSSLWEC